MEIGPVPRPGTSNVSPVSRVVPPASAKTQLPTVAVEQVPDAPASQRDAERRPGDPNVVDRQITIDPATQQVIYRAVDQASGEVVRQVPEEVMLRLQVYARALRRLDSRKQGELLVSA